MQKSDVTAPTASDTQLPVGYTRPTPFSTPPPDKLTDAVRLLLTEVESLVGTDHYAHQLEHGEKVIVAYQLVDRLIRPCGQALAYWAVHAAIEQGLLKAHRRHDTVLVATPLTEGNEIWCPEVRWPTPLVPDFDPDRQPAVHDGMPAPNREFDHLRRRFESFVVTFSPRSLPVPPPAPDDGPLDERCNRFRYHGEVFSFTTNQAMIVLQLWHAHQSGSPFVAGKTLTKDIETKRVARVFRCRAGSELVQHKAYGSLICQRGRGDYYLNLDVKTSEN